MTDGKTPEPGGRDPKAPLGTSPGWSGRMPPLGWIVAGLLVAIVAVALGTWSATHRTPQGESVPVASSKGTMPPAPAGGAAPATPGSPG